MPARSPRFAPKLARIAILSALMFGSIAGLASRPGVIAQEIAATPIVDGANESANAFTSAAALTLTLDKEQVHFGQLQAGGAMHLEDAVVVTISGSEGTTWQLFCAASPTASHTTNAPVDTLVYAPADTTIWASFPPSPAPCLPPMNGDAAYGFDYQVQIPVTATAGAYELVVTYSVATLD